MLKRIGVGLLAIIIWAFCLELGERLEIPGVHSFVSTAEAVIGRPLTPVSARSPPVASRGRRICLPIPRWRANPIGYQPSNIRTDVTGVSAVSRVATVRTYPP